ncbi:hypothetical protein BpHYR1_029226 [Brachionus plicatilis]|uniref:Uncharacterized protein n=1 Tax=Brachionus plicatilis TaxID=10195 RepID=A0A3M7S3Y3_BRAPC|nr:hypothetical protein BpHYR1_029226 [Brachionus plicatilis]
MIYYILTFHYASFLKETRGHYLENDINRGCNKTEAKIQNKNRENFNVVSNLFHAVKNKESISLELMLDKDIKINKNKKISRCFV